MIGATTAGAVAPETAVPRGDALVLYSGGQDSTTCLAWALQRYLRVETVGFDYGQRHHVEMSCRLHAADALRALCPEFRDRLGADHVVDLRSFGALARTAMTEDIAIETTANGLPNTFVPGRNLIFLQVAASLATSRGLRRLVGGMSEMESSGYPDCRRAALDAMQAALNLGMKADLEIVTPLMARDKAAVWALATAIGGEALLDLIVEETHSCYLGRRHHRYEWGYGCGTCPACELRARGYRRFRADRVKEGGS